MKAGAGNWKKLWNLRLNPEILTALLSWLCFAALHQSWLRENLSDKIYLKSVLKASLNNQLWTQSLGLIYCSNFCKFGGLKLTQRRQQDFFYEQGKCLYMWFTVHMFVFKSGQCELLKINKEESKIPPLKNQP